MWNYFSGLFCSNWSDLLLYAREILFYFWLIFGVDFKILNMWCMWLPREMVWIQICFQIVFWNQTPLFNCWNYLELDLIFRLSADFDLDRVATCNLFRTEKVNRRGKKFDWFSRQTLRRPSGVWWNVWIRLNLNLVSALLLTLEKGEKGKEVAWCFAIITPILLLLNYVFIHLSPCEGQSYLHMQSLFKEMAFEVEKC